jgi:hypothetical protein
MSQELIFGAKRRDRGGAEVRREEEKGKDIAGLD